MRVSNVLQTVGKLASSLKTGSQKARLCDRLASDRPECAKFAENLESPPTRLMGRRKPATRRTQLAPRLRRDDRPALQARSSSRAAAKRSRRGRRKPSFGSLPKTNAQHSPGLRSLAMTGVAVRMPRHARRLMRQRPSAVHAAAAARCVTPCALSQSKNSPAARVRIADVGGEEFEEAIGSMGAARGEKSRSISSGDGRERVHGFFTCAALRL